MTELSPAQAVLDAAHEAWITKDDPRSIAAAVLRAVVAIETHNPWGGRIESVGSIWMRGQILAIATELENHQ